MKTITTPKPITTRRERTPTPINAVYVSPEFTLLADLRNPYLQLGDHPEWHQQFRACIGSPKVHQILRSKLARFAPFVLVYSKIWPDAGEVRRLSGCAGPTVCIISSVGENPITPWMILHNVGHSYLSWHVGLKREVTDLLGLDPVHYRVAPLQAHLVRSAAARKGLIPNLAETLYELFTTWVWYGRTRSGDARLAAWGDTTFARVMREGRARTVWHRYRRPTVATEADVAGLAGLLA